MSVLEGNDRFRRDRGCAYLLDHIRPDGRVGDGNRGVAD